MDNLAIRKLCQFLFALSDPREGKVFIGSDLANAHEHPLTKDAFRSTNNPYVLLRGATSKGAAPDNTFIHKNIKSLTKRNQKNRRLIAWRKAKRELSSGYLGTKKSSFLRIYISGLPEEIVPIW